MQQRDEDLHNTIDTILQEQKLAVMATERDGQPYSSLMAFAASDDLATLVVATGSATRKYLNLRRQPRVSLLIDTRSNSAADFHRAAAVTVLGRAAAADKEGHRELVRLYLAKHPYLEDFLRAPSTSLITVSVHHYLLVSRFQDVMEYHLRDEDDIFA